METDTESPTLHDAVAVFLLDCEARNFTKSTLTYYRFRLGKLVAHFSAPVALAAVTATDIRAHLTDLAHHGHGGYSQLGSYRAARAFFNFCIREGWLTKSPTATMHAPRVEKRQPVIFTPAQVRAILAACNTPRDTAIVYVLLDTGLRRGELVVLLGRDINLDTGAVTVRQGKGQKDRTVFAGAKTRRAVSRYYAQRGRPGSDDAVWLSIRTGDALTVNGLAQAMKRISRRAGFPVHPHTFRRTFATASLRAGMDLETLRILMGHEDLQTMRRYVLLTGEDLRTAQKRFGVVDAMT